jgi:hypothetical protein
MLLVTVRLDVSRHVSQAPRACRESIGASPASLGAGDGLARESPMSPVPIPLALGRAASGRAAEHPATAFSSDLGRVAWRAGSGSGAAFAAMSWMRTQEPILGDKRTCDALDLIIVPRVRDLGGGFSVHRALPHVKVTALPARLAADNVR